MAEARVGQRRQVLHSIGFDIGEGQIGAARCLGHAGIKSAEVAQMQFVECDVLGRLEGWLVVALPFGGHQRRVIQVHNLAARAIGAQAERVGVCHDVDLYKAGAGHKHAHLVQVVGISPGRLSRHAPHAVGGLHGDCLRWGVGGGVIKEQQAHALGCGRPHTNGGHVTLPCHAQRAVIGKELVEHTRDLQARGVYQRAVRIGHLQRQLRFEQRRHLVQAIGRQAQRQIAIQLRELDQRLRAQPCGVQRERRRGHTTAHHAVHRQLHAAIRGIKQHKGGLGDCASGGDFGRGSHVGAGSNWCSGGNSGCGIGDGVGRDPLRACLAQVAIGANAGVGPLGVEFEVARNDPCLRRLRQVKEHVGAGVLGVTAVDDKAQLGGIGNQRDFPVDAKVVRTGLRQGRAPLGRRGGVFPNVQTPAPIHAIGAEIMNHSGVGAARVNAGGRCILCKGGRSRKNQRAEEHNCEEDTCKMRQTSGHGASPWVISRQGVRHVGERMSRCNGGSAETGRQMGEQLPAKLYCISGAARKPRGESGGALASQRQWKRWTRAASFRLSMLGLAPEWH